MGTRAADPLPLILVAQHDRSTVDLLRSLLETEGYTVLCAYNGRVAAELARQHKPALLLLDQRLPLLDGLELCRQRRRGGDEAAIFIVSSQPDELNKLLAFGAGADDYLALPMHPHELLSRARAALRRVGRATTRQRRLLRYGSIVLDPERREVRVAGTAVALTGLEFELLAVFVSQPGRVFNREELLARLAGFLRGEPFDRAVDVHVSNLRRKVQAALGGTPPLETVRGVGYRLRPTGADEAAPAGGDAGEDVPATPAASLDRLALAALERAPVPLLVLASDRTVLLYNEAAEHLCGWRASEVAGQVKCYSLLGCHDAAGELLCHARCVLRGGSLGELRDQQAHYVITCKDGRELAVEAHYSQLGQADDGAERTCTLLMLRPHDASTP